MEKEGRKGRGGVRSDVKGKRKEDYRHFLRHVIKNHNTRKKEDTYLFFLFLKGMPYHNYTTPRSLILNNTKVRKITTLLQPVKEIVGP